MLVSLHYGYSKSFLGNNIRILIFRFMEVDMSWILIFRFMEVDMSCRKNALSILREWKKILILKNFDVS